MRSIGTIAVVILGVLLASVTYRWEAASRYHLDSLREERRHTTRVFGVPIWSTEQPPNDPYAGLYSQITGRPPDPERWKQMRPDFVRSLGMSRQICYAFSLKFQERRELLAGVYERYRSVGSRSEAAAQLQRIDDLLPVVANPEHDLDYAGLDALRKELGLKPHLNP